MIAAGEKLLGVLAGWRGYAAATIAGAALAWTVQGWRYGAELANQRADRAEEVADGQRQARKSWRGGAPRWTASTNATPAPSGRHTEGCAMRKYRTMACGLILMLGASGCTSVPPAPPLAVECPRPAPPPAWVMEPAPSLIPLLDRIISPSGRESSR